MTDTGAMDFWLEVFKSSLSLLVVIFALNQLSTKWTIHQKKKEMVISTLDDLYKLYGKIFSLTKLYREKGTYTKRDGTKHMGDGEIMKKIVEEAYNTEGKLEAILVKIASEKKLNDAELEILGRFHQSSQALREHIRNGEDIPWYSSDESEYLTFKRLTYLVARIIQSSMHVKFFWNILTPEYESYTKINEEALRIITHNYWEENWNGWRIKSKEDWENLCNFESADTPEAIKGNIENIRNISIKY